jgi:hypothetical protein
MFKYVKFTEVKDEFTTHTFRGGDDAVKVNTFTGCNVVSVESESEDDIDSLISAQVEVIGCEIIDKDEFKNTVSSSAQVLRILSVASSFLEKELEGISNKYPTEERDTWNIQKEEALAYKADSSSDTPFLDVLSDAKGISVDDLATAVLENSETFAKLSSLALGKKQALQKNMLADIGL